MLEIEILIQKIWQLKILKKKTVFPIRYISRKNHIVPSTFTGRENKLYNAAKLIMYLNIKTKYVELLIVTPNYILYITLRTF